MIQRVYVALGSNLAEPREQIQAALDAFERLPETRLVAVSPLCFNPCRVVRVTSGMERLLVGPVMSRRGANGHL